MTVNGKLKYQSCRESAGLTQEQAAAVLCIEPATLSRYENGHFLVPQDIVAAMVKVYRTPTLAWWHVIHVNPELAQYLPEPPKMSTYGDLMLRIEYAEDDLSEMRDGLKDIFKDGVITLEESDRLERKAGRFRDTASKLMESAGYMDEIAMEARIRFNQEGGFGNTQCAQK